ncbi:IS30 family transposase [Nitrospira sp. M1]
MDSNSTRKAEFKPFLRQGGKQRRKHYGSGARASSILNRVSITERPQEVEEKTRLGDWECDTVIGADRKSVLVTVVDRASLYTVCSRVLSRSAQEVSQAIIRLLRPFKERVQTLTFDNGTEFVRHKAIAHALEATTYFAHPYSSWECGINENTNGLLRQFFPKRTHFRTVSWQQVKHAVDHLNNRPRKTRGYQPPNQLFHHHFVPLV